MGVSGQSHAPAAPYLRERTPGTHWVEGWVDLRAGLNTEVRGKILYLCWGLNPGRPVYPRIINQRKGWESEISLRYHVFVPLCAACGGRAAIFSWFL
jgi:hypothetical protein